MAVDEHAAIACRSGRRRLDEAREDAARRRQSRCRRRSALVRGSRSCAPVRRDRRADRAAWPPLSGMKGCDQDRDAADDLGQRHRAPSPCAPDRSCAAPTAPARRHSDWPSPTTCQIASSARWKACSVDLGAHAAVAAPRAASSSASSARGEARRAPARAPPQFLAIMRQHALRQIAEIVGEIAVDAVDHGAMREIAVIAEGQLAQQEIAHRVERRSARPAASGVDDVAERFRHLLALDGPPAMGEDAPRRRQLGRHQEGRPIDRVEAQDVLADHVQIGRPEALVSWRSRYRDSRRR